jgi:hypothetical protein
LCQVGLGNMNELPKINLKRLKEQKERNFKDRLKFIDQHTDWLLKNKKGVEII